MLVCGAARVSATCLRVLSFHHCWTAALASHSASGVAYLKSHKDQYMEKLVSWLINRVKVQHPDLLTDALTALATYVRIEEIRRCQLCKYSSPEFECLI